jgi:hypothetical protein
VRTLAKGLGLGLGLFLAAAGCSSGVNCTDKGGICNPGVVCPSGTQEVTAAQLTAAGVDSEAYACPVVADSGTTDLPICCLPSPASN